MHTYTQEHADPLTNTHMHSIWDFQLVGNIIKRATSNMLTITINMQLQIPRKKLTFKDKCLKNHEKHKQKQGMDEGN